MENTVENRYVKAGVAYRLWIKALILWQHWGVYWDNQHIQCCQEDITKAMMLRATRIHRINQLSTRL